MKTSYVTPNPISSFLTLFKPQAGRSKRKSSKIYERSQTMDSSDPNLILDSAKDSLKPSPLSVGIVQSAVSSPSTPSSLMFDASIRSENEEELPELDPTTSALGQATAPAESNDANDYEKLVAPPRTTLLEAAGDVLNPPLPPLQFIINPASRERTVYHDRVYHPEDIPPVPSKSSNFLRRTNSSGGHLNPPSPAKVHLKPEEKIARAYHEEVSWRKVLVRLEPDAHNNMIVRREFSNAYGWPVVKHLVDTHFGDSYAAMTRDDDEDNTERALGVDNKTWTGGNDEVRASKVQDTAQHFPKLFTPSQSNDDNDDEKEQNFKENSKHLPEQEAKPRSAVFALEPQLSPSQNEDSGIWSDGAFATDDEDEDEEEKDERVRMERINSFLNTGKVKVDDGTTSTGGQGIATKVGIGPGLGDGAIARKLTRLQSMEESNTRK